MQNTSTWRSNTYVLHPGLNEIFFNDTNPNAFYLVNNNNTYLYIGLKFIPSKNKFEYKIKPNDSDCFGRPLPVNRIYLINPTTVDITIELASIHEVFNISLLKSLNASMDDEQLNKISFDGIINGWHTDDTVFASLTNVDDVVKPLKQVISDMSDQNDKYLSNLSVSNNHISDNTSLIVTNTNNILTDTQLLCQKLNDVISNINDIINKLHTTPKQKYFIKNLDISTDDVIINIDTNIKDIILISNDTAFDINVKLNDDILFLKKDEVIDNLKNIYLDNLDIIPLSPDGQLYNGKIRIIYTKEAEQIVTKA